MLMHRTSWAAGPDAVYDGRFHAAFMPILVPVSLQATEMPDI
jgi:hypothetical protein